MKYCLIKNTLFIFSCILCFNTIYAQSLKVTYQEHSARGNSGNLTISNHVLLATPTASLYKTISSEHQGDNMVIKTSFIPAVYKNLIENTVMNQHAVLRKSIPVKDTLSSMFQWELVAGSREILGYPCKKATMHYRGRDYVAWYSLQIPVQNGPKKFHGLPGLILAIKNLPKNDQDLEFSIAATSIEFPEEAPEICNPFKGADFHSWNYFVKKYRRMYERLNHYVTESGGEVSVSKGGFEIYVYE